MKQSRLQIPIPAWGVAMVGSLLVILSTIVETLLIQGNNAQIKAKHNKQLQFQTSWDGHKLAEARFAQAEILAGIYAQNIDGGMKRFLVPRIAENMKDAIYTMHLSYSDVNTSQQSESGIFRPNCEGREKTPDLENTVNKLVEEFRGGNLNAYDSLVKILDQERLLSACKLNEKGDSIDELEKEISQIEAQSKLL